MLAHLQIYLLESAPIHTLCKAQVNVAGAKNSKAELQIRVWSRRGAVQSGVGDERQRIDIPSERLEMAGANVRLLMTALQRPHILDEKKSNRRYPLIVFSSAAIGHVTACREMP